MPATSGNPSVFRALFIHGVGEQKSDFAADARSWLRRQCQERGMSLYSLSIHWAPLADRPEERFLKAAEAAGSRGNLTQRLVVGTLADALMYRCNAPFRQQIYNLIDQQIWMLGGGQGVTIFAHSLGGLIATDYLRDRPEIRNVKLVTFGCNIGLFNLGQNFAPVPGVASWHNYYSPRDMLGFPLEIDPSLSDVVDHKVSVGGWFRGWTGLAHTLYWGDSGFWNRELPKAVF